jgi:hypothetical protein
MTCALLWDAAPGEIRAGLVEDGALTEFRIIRPSRRGSYLAVGQLYTARIVENQGAGKALVTLGGGVEAHLERAPRVPEGTFLAVEIVRASIPEPGRWKQPLVRARSDLVASSSEGPYDIGRRPWAYFFDEWRGKVERIICCDATAMQQVSTSVGLDGPPVSVNIAAFEEADFDSVAELAVTGEFGIAGGMLTIERTRAMTTIDIDGSGDSVALNLAAALEIPRLLRLLDIGGQVGIDFLAMPDRNARLSVDAALAQACAVLGPHERTAINGFGFAQIVRPRPRPSIPEMLSGTTPGRLSTESRAVALLREAARSTGFGKRQLFANPAIIDMLRGWTDELEALQKQLGVVVELVSDSSVGGYGHVHVSQS